MQKLYRNPPMSPNPGIRPPNDSGEKNPKAKILFLSGPAYFYAVLRSPIGILVGGLVALKLLANLIGWLYWNS
jgi:hypothetical protein